MYSDLGQKEPALAALNKIEQLKRAEYGRIRRVAYRKGPLLPRQPAVLVQRLR